MLHVYRTIPIIGIAAILSVILLAQPSFPHDTGTTEILEELRSLRDDLEAFIVPADVSGRWQFGNDVSCSGNLPEWAKQALEDADAEFEDTFRIRQYGNHFSMDRAHADGRVASLPGIIRGDYMRLERIIDISGSSGIYDWTFIGRTTIDATMLSARRIDYTAHLELTVETGFVLTTWASYARTCTGEWRRIGG